MSLLVKSDVLNRLIELTSLRDGWLDGEGKALNPILLYKFRVLFEKYYPSDLPMPYTYPTPEGEVQFSWSFNGETPEMDIDLTTLKGEWLYADEDLVEIDLSSVDGWEYLSGRIEKIANEV